MNREAGRPDETCCACGRRQRVRASDEHTEITGAIIGACIEVHRELGPGLLESAYEIALERELTMRGLSFERQVEIPVRYKGALLPSGYRADLIVEKVVVELKAVVDLLPVHEAQLLTYLRLTGLPVGLLVNFNVPALRDGGVRRMRSNVRTR